LNRRLAVDELIERLHERAEFEDKRVLDEAKAMGFEPEVYTGSQTGAVLREAAAALEAAREDAARLDWLEAEAEGGIRLHSGDFNGRHVGLGLNLGSSRRTLRAAIDQARGKGGGEVGT
jgi:hypothetical protein